MRKIIICGLALTAMSVSACAKDPITCSSKEASDTLRDLIQTKVVAPVVEAQRKLANDGFEFQKILHAPLIADCRNHAAAFDRPACEKAAVADASMELKAILEKIVTAPILFDVRDVVTADKTAYKTTCKATIHWSGGDGWWTFSTNDAPFTFTVEKTDDGNLYVTEFGLGQSLK